MSARLPTTPKMPGNKNEPLLKKGKFVVQGRAGKKKKKTSMMTFFYDKRREKKNMGFSGWPAAAIAD